MLSISYSLTWYLEPLENHLGSLSPMKSFCCLPSFWVRSPFWWLFLQPLCALAATRSNSPKADLHNRLNTSQRLCLMHPHIHLFYLWSTTLVLYVPNYPFNLLFATRLIKSHDIIFTNKWYLTRSNNMEDWCRMWVAWPLPSLSIHDWLCISSFSNDDLCTLEHPKWKKLQ